MKPLTLLETGGHLSVLAIGAHADDIEIGVGGTLLGWIANGVSLDVHWCVLGGERGRSDEAQRSAEAFLAGARNFSITVEKFRDRYFPSDRDAIKAWLEDTRAKASPDVIFCHHGDDAHQDHRTVAELVGTTYRDHLILGYEIPKWDGDLSRPNAYVSLHAKHLERKIALLLEHFATQRSKDWFDADVFRGLARLRGMECRSPSRYAEAFHIKKMVLA
ncbi:MAG: PIG-L deacetylase family protein [Pseudomonadota bacterium]